MSVSGGKRLWIWIFCAGLMAMAVLLAETRAVWIGTAIAFIGVVAIGLVAYGIFCLVEARYRRMFLS